MDGTSGVMLMRPIEPVIANISVSLATGRTLKCGTLCALRKGLFGGEIFNLKCGCRSINRGRRMTSSNSSPSLGSSNFSVTGFTGDVGDVRISSLIGSNFFDVNERLSSGDESDVMVNVMRLSTGSPEG